MKDIQDVMAFQETRAYDKVSTFADIFRYASLRGVTIAQGLVSISTYLIYYGPTLIIGQFGFDIYTSNLVLNTADILTYYPLMLIIDKIRRRRICMLLFFIATVISAALIFLVKPQDCDNCSIIYIQLALVFVFRFCISMEFTVMLVYQSEIYPTRVRNIGNGLLGVFGTTTSTLSPIVMGLFTRAELNPFILFTCLGILAIGCYLVSPETFQKVCPEEIEEI
jgi:OCT family organic cation transporter-like MFS transporter 13